MWQASTANRLYFYRIPFAPSSTATRCEKLPWTTISRQRSSSGLAGYSCQRKREKSKCPHSISFNGNIAGAQPTDTHTIALDKLWNYCTWHDCMLTGPHYALATKWNFSLLVIPDSRCFDSHTLATRVNSIFFCLQLYSSSYQRLLWNLAQFLLNSCLFTAWSTLWSSCCLHLHDGVLSPSGSPSNLGSVRAPLNFSLPQAHPFSKISLLNPSILVHEP